MSVKNASLVGGLQSPAMNARTPSAWNEHCLQIKCTGSNRSEYEGHPQTASHGIKLSFILILLYIKVLSFPDNAACVVLKRRRIIELFGVAVRPGLLPFIGALVFI